MNVLILLAAVLTYLSLSVQSYNIIQESESPLHSYLPSASAHGRRSKRYNEINDAIRKWPNAIAYYTIEPSLEKLETEILRAIRHIEETTCIQFISRTDEINYMSLKMVETACIALVGFQNSGQQDVLIYEPECGFYSYFLHQLIQSLGATHEHQRFDRDDYITVQTQDIPESALGYFRKMNESSHIRSDVYDFDSVMHYGSFRFRTNQDGPAMLFKNGSVIPELQTKTQLSDLDIAGLNLLYECNKATRYFISAGNSLVFTILCALAYLFAGVRSF